MASWWVYILRCRDDTLYTGMARDLDRRLVTHVRGRASKYTRVRRPLRLVYREPRRSRASAARREAAIKRLSRAEKLALIARAAS